MKLKKIAASVLAAVMLSGTAAIGAFADTVGVTGGTLDEATGLLFVGLDDGSLAATIPDGTTLTGDIVIPETFEVDGEEKTVTQISHELVHCTGEATSISIPSTVMGFMKQNEMVYQHRSNLQRFTVDEDNTVFSSVDGVLFNKDKTTLYKYPSAKTGSTYSIPEGVEVIDAWSFSGAKISNVTIPDSVTGIFGRAFAYSELTQLHIPANVFFIYGGIIADTDVTTITVDSNNTEFKVVDNVLFATYGGDYLTAYPVADGKTTYTIPDGTVGLASYLFSGDQTIKSITIPDSVYEIEQYAFAWSSVETIAIPEGVAELRGTFCSCDKLTEVTIPTTVTDIYKQTFYGCNNLTTVNYNGTKEQWAEITISAVENEALNNATIKCTDGDISGTIVENPKQEPAKTEITNEDGSKSDEYTPAVEKNNVTISEEMFEDMKDIRAVAPQDAFSDPVDLKVTPGAFPQGGNGSFAVDISFVNSSTKAKVQPSKPVTVKIPVPESLKNVNPIYVYHINNGRTEQVPANTEVIGDKKYVVFEASSFSVYALTASAVTTTLTPATPVTPTTDTTVSSEPTSSTSSDTTSSEPTSSATTSSETASSDTTSSELTSSAANGQSNPTTGIALACAPILMALGTVAAASITRKRK